MHDAEPLAFEYAPGWLHGAERMALAAIPRQAGRQVGPQVQAFFENLLPEGELRDYLAAQRKASTHILKPNIRRLAKVWHSAANKAIVMRAAALAGTLSDRKYEKEGGPGLAACAELIRRHSTQPAVDLRHLVRWVFFNLYTGNNDSHAKNLSVYRLPGQGVTLTPFYDLMCTRLYPGLSPEFAFTIGGEVRPGELGAEHLAAMARQLSMQPRYLAQQAQDMADRVTAVIGQAAREVAPALPPSASTLAERLERFVVSTTKKLATRMQATD